MSDVDLTHSVMQALRQRHPVRDAVGATRGVLLEEVRNSTGFSATRSCDAMAFEFWPSAGLHITGYEVKASRADWLRELKDPEKAFTFSRYCDFWWVAAASKDVVQLEELPPMWGLLVLNAKGKLHPVVGAKQLPAEPMSRAVLMSVIRAACSSTFEPLVAARVEVAIRQANAGVVSQLRNATRDLEDLQRRVREFEEASGISIGGHSYGSESPERIGGVVRAVRSVLGAGYDGALQTVNGHADVLRRLVEQCERASEEIVALRDADQSKARGAA